MAWLLDITDGLGDIWRTYFAGSQWHCQSILSIVSCCAKGRHGARVARSNMAVSSYSRPFLHASRMTLLRRPKKKRLISCFDRPVSLRWLLRAAIKVDSKNPSCSGAHRDHCSTIDKRYQTNCVCELVESWLNPSVQPSKRGRGRSIGYPNWTRMSILSFSIDLS